MRFLGKITKIISSTNIAYPKSFVCLFFSLSPLLPLFFLLSCALKDRKLNNREKVLLQSTEYSLHSVFCMFWTFVIPLFKGHLHSGDIKFGPGKKFT